MEVIKLMTKGSSLLLLMLELIGKIPIATRPSDILRGQANLAVVLFGGFAFVIAVALTWHTDPRKLAIRSIAACVTFAAAVGVWGLYEWFVAVRPPAGPMYDFVQVVLWGAMFGLMVGAFTSLWDVFWLRIAGRRRDGNGGAAF